MKRRTETYSLIFVVLVVMLVLLPMLAGFLARWLV